MSDLESWARQLPRSDYDRLKAAWRDLVEACGGPDRVSKLTRARNHSLITEYGKPHCLDRFPPLDVIADLEAECGQPIVTRVVADMLGFDLVARETKATGTDCEQFAGIAREAGEALEVFAKALDNGKVDRFEIPAIRKALHELMEKVHAVDAALDAKLKVRAVS